MCFMISLKCDGETFLNHHQLINTNQYTLVDIKLVLFTMVSAHHTGVSSSKIQGELLRFLSYFIQLSMKSK